MQTVSLNANTKLADFASPNRVLRILDVALARMIGAEYPRNIRPMIAKNAMALASFGDCHAVKETPYSLPSQLKAFYLNRDQAIYLLRLANPADPVGATVKVLDAFRAQEGRAA